MFKVKFILYLIVSDYVLNLNSQELTTLSSFQRLRAKVGGTLSAKTNRPTAFASSTGTTEPSTTQPLDPTSDVSYNLSVSFGFNENSTIDPNISSGSGLNTSLTGIPTTIPSFELTTGINDGTDLLMLRKDNKERNLRPAEEGPPMFVFADGLQMYGPNETKEIADKFKGLQTHQIKRSHERLEGTKVEYYDKWSGFIEGHTPEYASIQTPLIDRYNDDDYLIATASHGLHFYPNGEVYVFIDQFDHYLTLDLPQMPIIEDVLFREWGCNWFETRQTHMLNITESDFTDRQDCDRMKYYTGKIVEEFNNILESAYSEFKEKHLREKRFVIVGTVLGVVGVAAVASTVAGAISGGVAGHLTAKHHFKGIDERLVQMEANLSSSMQSIRINNEILTGLSKQVVGIQENVDKKIEIIKNNVRFQTEILEKSITDMARTMEKQEKIRAAQDSAKDFINMRLNSARNVMELELEKLQVWERIFSVLNDGRIPTDILSFNALKNLLGLIKPSLNSLFDLAIQDEDFTLYYTLPICSYGFYKPPNETYAQLALHIRIPLKQRLGVNKYKLITPIARGFPCLDDNCLLGRTKGDSLQQFDLEQTSYLINPKNNKMIFELNLDHIDCHESGKARLCHTFRPTLLQQPSYCTMAIFEWDENKIIEHCKFKLTSRDNYKVIPIRVNQYLLHKDIVKEYWQSCGGLEIDNHTLIEWSETLDIPKNCDVMITATKQRLFGPFGDILRSASYAERITYHSSLIGKIYDRYSNKTIKFFLPKPLGLIERIEENFNQSHEELNEMDYKLNDDQLAKVTAFNTMAQNRLGNALEFLENKMQTFRYTSTFWGYFSLLGNAIQMTTTLIVVFGILSYTRLFGLIASTIIILEPTRVTGWELQLIPDLKLLPDINLDVMNDTVSISWIMNIAFVFLFAILLFLFIYYGTFRKIRLSFHYAKVFPSQWHRVEGQEPPVPSTLMININYRENFLRFIKIENIHLKVRIDFLFTERIKDIAIKNTLNVWYIVKNNGMTGISLNEPIQLIGLDRDGRRIEDAQCEIFIPLTEIEWNTNPSPLAFDKIGNNGLAIIMAVKKYTGVRWGTSRPRISFVTPLDKPTAPEIDENI